MCGGQVASSAPTNGNGKKKKKISHGSSTLYDPYNIEDLQFSGYLTPLLVPQTYFRALGIILKLRRGHYFWRS